MIYIVPVLLLFCLFVRFDLGRNQKGMLLWFYFLLILFITIGGFEYNVGSDMPAYMDEYDDYHWSDIKTVGDLMGYRHRQPGWVLLNLIFKSISSNFALFQFFNALFFNIVFFFFIKRNTGYLFLGLLFYAVAIYLNLNFNILRQAYSICFFLIGYNFLRQKRLVVYYIFATLAFMFHTSAIICFVIPLLLFFKFTPKSIIFFGLSLFVLILLSLNHFFDDILSSLFFDLLSEEGTMQTIGEIGNKFMGSHYERTETINIFGIVELLLSIGVIIFVAIYNSLYNKNCDSVWNGILFLYAICTIMDIVVPVLFYRFMYFFQIFYYISLGFCVVNLTQRLFNRNRFITAVACLFFAISPVMTLFNINPDSGIPLISQFYPYHSIFDKQIDPVRASHFGSHR